MGTNYYAVKKKPTIREPLHIGKSSVGWKFLFQEVNKYNCFDEDLEIHTFNQWKDFLENNDEIVILNEYDEEISVDEFLDLVAEKQKNNNKDNFEYCKNVNGYRFSDREFS
jgi:hypothetical protein